MVQSLFHILAFLFVQLCFAVKHPAEHVNTLGGTASTSDFSTGNTLPLVARPWGFNSWAPMTADGGSWWFHPDNKKYYG